MLKRLIDVQGFIDAASGDDTALVHTWRELRDLADELNSALPEYRVSLEHYDTGDFLAFEQRDPAEVAAEIAAEAEAEA